MNDHSKKLKILLITTAIVLLLALIYLIHWAGWSRFIEESNDAYVNGNAIQVSPQHSGIVTAIYADNTQLVEAGQPLIQLDPHDFEVELDMAKAGLAGAVREVEQLFIKVKELTARQESALAELFRANQDFHHRQALLPDGGISMEDFEHSQVTLYSSYANLKQVTEALEGARAQIQNTTLLTHPKIEQAKASLRRAFLAWHRSTILAPVRGIVTQRKAQLGKWVAPSESLLWIVPLDQLWVDANFRESDLKNVRVGQPVKLIADMYGSSAEFQGRVVGLNPGTGSVFSVIPPQNASGNWIKIIQRVPVKISLENKELEKWPLFLGLSMTASINTRTRSGDRLPKPNPQEAIYKTDIYKDELQGSNQMIEKIIAENLYCHDNPTINK